ncbi:MAG: chaperonin GroEL [Chloroflexi bacterium]|nr:chaperonin GroEL [Chloroflexota bacterium]
MLTGPAARAALIRGATTMTRLIRPTLGPVARTVAIMPLVGSGPPEVLDSGGTIARRTIQIDDPFEDIGAMLIRHLVWRVFEDVGDGAATAAVLAERLLIEAERQVAAGASPVALRRGIERGLDIAREGLRRQARRVDSPDEIVGVVAGVLRDPKLAAMVAEVVDGVGPEGAVLVEEAAGAETDYEYVEGVRWDGGWLSPAFHRGIEPVVRLLEPAILLVNFALDNAEQLLPAVEATLASGRRSLFVVAPEASEPALSLLLVNRERGILDEAVAVKAPSMGRQRLEILDDLAAIVGARCFDRDRGDRLENLTAEDLGSARQAWARRSTFGFLGGRGDRAAVRRRMVAARGELSQAGNDTWLRGKIRERIGKLAGAVAVILAGAPTPADRAELKVRVEAAVATARAGLRDGVVPGGGAAYLACVPALEAAAKEMSGDEKTGIQVLARALGGPMAAIAANAGLAPAPILHAATQRPPGSVFDVLRGEWVDPWESGLLDSLAVLQAALDAAGSAAATALTSDVLIHRPDVEPSFEP